MSVASIIQTIQLIIVPVVMVTACALLINGILGRYAAVNDRLRLLARERLDLLRRDGGGCLALPPGSDAYAIERLAQIDAQVPGLLRRHRYLRDALVLIYIAVVIFLLSMFSIAAASTAHPPVLDISTLVIFLLGTAALFVGVIIETREVWLSHVALHFEVNRVMDLGR